LDLFDRLWLLFVHWPFDVFYSKEERKQRQRHRELFRRLASKKQSWIVTTNGKNTIFTTILDCKEVVLENRYICQTDYCFLGCIPSNECEERYVNILRISDKEIYHGCLRKTNRFLGEYCGLVDELHLILALRYANATCSRVVTI